MSARPAGRDLVVVANRLPVHRAGPDDPWADSPGGVVRALGAALRERHGTWVGWTGTTGDAVEPLDHDGMALVPVEISAEEHEGHYSGFSNGALWPLYHDAIREPTFDEASWQAYVTVNRRFAQRTAEVAPTGADVWVHDYQLQLVPAMLRELRPDVSIGFFLHIPFPPPELFLQLPWRDEIIAGLLGADLIGVQRPGAVTNVVTAALRVHDAAETEGGLVHDGRRIAVEAIPVSIDLDDVLVPASRPGIDAEVAALRARIGDPDVVFLGVDRLDYTKGLRRRLEAFRALLEQGVLDPTRHVMVQVAVPTREGVEHYTDIRNDVERLVGEINGRFGRLGQPVLSYLYRSLPLDELVVLYRAADVMLVTPLRDGMNLVAKEYVASRVDGDGVLVLSEFAGAVEELDTAVVVNPYDSEALRRAFVKAALMPEAEARRRMAHMHEVVLHNDVHHWVERFLSSLALAAKDGLGLA